jgi:hypothetical protein
MRSARAGPRVDRVDEARTGARRHLVESYWPGVTEARLARSTRRVQAAARRLRQDGHDIRFLTGMLVPEDEVGLCLFEAGSRESVEEACRRGGLPFDRILEVTLIRPATTSEEASQ